MRAAKLVIALQRLINGAALDALCDPRFDLRAVRFNAGRWTLRGRCWRHQDLAQLGIVGQRQGRIKPARLGGQLAQLPRFVATDQTRSCQRPIRVALAHPHQNIA